jgi:hypothetical protein
MVTIAIQAEEQLVSALQEIARQKQTTVEDVAKEALLHYVQVHPDTLNQYSFIGIGHSGKENISTQVDQTLEKAANRREGLSLTK